MPSAPVTPKMLEQLQVLQRAGATSLQSALGPYDGKPFNAGVLSRLVTCGWAEAKTLRAGAGGGLGSQKTVYWLTPAGLSEAERLP